MKSLEFFLKQDQVMVRYQDMTSPLRTFLIHPEGENLVQKIYLKIITDYRDKLPARLLDEGSKGQVVGEFIKKYFLESDKTFDVVFFPESGLLKFNLEEKK